MRVLKLLFLTSTISTAAFCQECPDNFLGTKTLYHIPGSKVTPVPNGYEPVFINHIGRHGARHLTKEVKKTLVYQVLLKADSAGALTQSGQQLKQMVLLLDQIETDNIESISAEGRMELKGIAQRMQAGNASLFSHPLQVNIGVTNKKRTKQSADAFLTGFTGKQTLRDYIDDTDLRFYDLSPAYLAFEQQRSWISEFAAFQKKEGALQISKDLTAKLFSKDFADKILQKEQQKITADVFGFASIVYSLQSEIEQAGVKPADINFKSLFSCAELERLGKMDDVSDFLKKGPGTDINGVQVRIAVPLLVNFIKTTDEFIQQGKYDIQLRFAHAETVAPFAAVLGISSADRSTTDFDQINASWKAAEVAPLSANIQWILYKNPGKNDYLVKVMLNEKEAHITGMNGITFPYYRYSDLRALYLARLKKLGVNINDDMNKYLQLIVNR